MDATYTITTAKSSHTGSLAEVCAWQAEHQGAAATVAVAGDDWSSVEVDDLDFDADDARSLELAAAAIVERIAGLE